VLAKFKTEAADITVYEPTNLLIVTDTGANIQRMLRIVEELDAGGGGEQLYFQPTHHQAPSELAEQLQQVLDIGTDGRARIVADDRNGTLVIVANDEDYKRILDILEIIDRPVSGEGQFHVIPLQHARCDELQNTLGTILGSGGGAARPTPAPRGRQQGGATPPASGTSTTAAGGESEIFEGAVKVNCDEATNSLVAVSSPRDYAQLRAVISKLDRARRQVFIEAVIMDVNIDHKGDFGVAFHGGATADLGGGGDTLFYGGSNPQQSLTGLPARLEALAFGVRGPDLEGTSDLLGTGVSIPAFGIVLHALAETGDSNVLATPHILATDNIEATISIGQNIPLQTNVGGGLGQLAGLAGLGGAQTGQANAGLGALGALGGFGLGFQAPRQDVGIKLTIKPQINDSDMVRMEISEEFSDAGSPVGALGAVPINKRTAETTIIVKDEQTVVIGGLMRDVQTRGETKIPVLGDIPVLGILFKRQQDTNQKTNLLLILTPHIIREQDDLRRIFERKMQERQEFLDRYFVFDDTLPWEPARDYTRANGLVEHIRQTQLAIEERERIEAELRPDAAKTHEAVKPLQLPSMAGSGGGTATGGAKTGGGATQPKTPAPQPGARPQPRPQTGEPAPRTPRPEFRVPGGSMRPNRYRVE
jgi:general secretion pathway protein D